ncbi:MAG: hypothetical protein PCFJNLEI_02595 [Verrucomicrobiae bacterium]|nr:hypothetical protein [Verrucomicrobiae bacterium]
MKPFQQPETQPDSDGDIELADEFSVCLLEWQLLRGVVTEVLDLVEMRREHNRGQAFFARTERRHFGAAANEFDNIHINAACLRNVSRNSFGSRSRGAIPAFAASAAAVPAA